MISCALLAFDAAFMALLALEIAFIAARRAATALIFFFIFSVMSSELLRALYATGKSRWCRRDVSAEDGKRHTCSEC